MAERSRGLDAGETELPSKVARYRLPREPACMGCQDDG